MTHFKRGWTGGKEQLLRAGDKRRLHDRVCREFPGCGGCVPFDAKADEIAETRITACDGSRVTIYGADSGAVPLFFEGPDAQLVPSVYALWRTPALLSAVSTPASVLDHLVNGAHLMIAGVTSGLQPGMWKQGELRAVVLDGNPYPVAVGRVACSS
jgi:predicted ribosome-associated RNA-binding protein Tma20